MISNLLLNSALGFLFMAVAAVLMFWPRKKKSKVLAMTAKYEQQKATERANLRTDLESEYTVIRFHAVSVNLIIGFTLNFISSIDPDWVYDYNEVDAIAKRENILIYLQEFTAADIENELAYMGCEEDFIESNSAYHNRLNFLYFAIMETVKEQSEIIQIAKDLESVIWLNGSSGLSSKLKDALTEAGLMNVETKALYLHKNLSAARALHKWIKAERDLLLSDRYVTDLEQRIQDMRVDISDTFDNVYNLFTAEIARYMMEQNTASILENIEEQSSSVEQRVQRIIYALNRSIRNDETRLHQPVIREAYEEGFDDAYGIVERFLNDYVGVNNFRDIENEAYRNLKDKKDRKEEVYTTLEYYFEFLNNNPPQ